jgi:putative oxidoreductase
MLSSEMFNLAGRVLVAGYFLWATAFNLKGREVHQMHFSSLGLPLAMLWHPLGLALQCSGAILLLIDRTAVWGGFMLIGFTLCADMLYHRFWSIDDPQERTHQKLCLYEHLELCGGMLGLLAAHF